MDVKKLLSILLIIMTAAVVILALKPSKLVFVGRDFHDNSINHGNVDQYQVGNTTKTGAEKAIKAEKKKQKSKNK